MNKNKLGYIYVLLAAFFFALIAVIGKTVISSGINVYDLLILQSGVALIFMLVYFAAVDIKKLLIGRKNLKTIIIQGVLGSATTTILFYMALERLNAGIASMLLFTHPVLVSLYFIATKTKKISVINNFALLSAFLGSALVLNVFKLDIAKTPVSGILLGIASSAAYAFYNIHADVKLKDFEPLVITFFTTLSILVVSLILRPGFFRFEFTMSVKLFAYVCELAVISGILPVIFLYKGISMVGAARASIVATAELPATIIMSYIVLSESMGPIQLVGIVFIMASIIILQYEEQLERRMRASFSREQP